MGDSPPSKKRRYLKQTTIEESFKRQRSSSTETATHRTGEKHQASSKVDIDLTEESPDDTMSNNSVTTKKKCGGSEVDRDKTAAAAEKRRKANTPNSSIDHETSPGRTVTSDSKGPSSTDAGHSGSCSGSGDGEEEEVEDYSADLFESSEDVENKGGAEAMAESYEDSEAVSPNVGSSSRGIDISELPTALSCNTVLPPIEQLARAPLHTVLFKLGSFKQGHIPQPYPAKYTDRWDQDHVKMPCSEENMYPVAAKGGKTDVKPRWKLIKDTLSQPLNNSLDLEEAILTYNRRYQQKWCFRGLHAYFMSEMEAEERQMFFESVLPEMVELALKLPEICTQPIPLLKRQKPHYITLSQKQVACLLANAFFCTFPRRNTKQRMSEYSDFPDINFNSLFQGGGRGSKNGVHPRKVEKLKCLLHYFRRVTKNMPEGTVTFKRQVIKDFPVWKQSAKEMTQLHVTSQGTIEDDGIGMLQVDFANKYLGGGVLGSGCVQEEIRFLICPEMILSRLFTEVLDRNEALIMTGCERFSNYTGYASSFKFNGNHEDPLSLGPHGRDAWGRLHCEVVAIDALVIRNHKDQFQQSTVQREINKAFCGFQCVPVADTQSKQPAVATGNWGCGAFGGDVKLKALIQIMAAAQAGRDVCYFTFKDPHLTPEELYSMHSLLREKQTDVSELWELIWQYYNIECRKPSWKMCDIFKFIRDALEGNAGDTDTTEENDGELVEQSHEVATKWEDSPDWGQNTP